MSNESQKAISVLKAKSLELNKVHNVQQGNTWKASLLATLVSYLGNDSAIITRLNGLHFTKRVSNNYPGMISSTNVYDETKKDNFRDLISSAVTYIETHGIKKTEIKGNMLKGFNNTQLIGGFFAASTLVFGIGNFVGKIEKDREIIETNSKFQTISEKYQKSLEANEFLKKENEILKAKPESK